MEELNSKDITQLRQFFEYSADQYPDRLALVCDTNLLTYRELEARSNQLAHYLKRNGVTENHSVGIFLERSLNSYISILAVLKTGASYVPIDVEYPDDRVNYILADMPFHSVITNSSQCIYRTAIQFPNTIVLDQVNNEVLLQATSRPELRPHHEDQLCYVIYTSGSTGKPKGVEITQKNICHYITVASSLYSMTPQDKVYQGFSLAFDASLEEVWMAFANGAALIACTSKDVRSGVGLVDFLNEHQVTVFSTVPTLLASIEGDLPYLRLLILGGEACTAQLVKRWSRDNLTIMNTYGPTEATVIATYSKCQLDKPVTIGKPLPGYGVLIVNERLEPVVDGQQGELCISGFGLARGYVNRPENTAQKFIKNPKDSSQRLYRTGDLAMIEANGEIQFLGRIDDQVKLRGFRIELNEIETVMMGYESISQAVVALHDIDNNPTLVAYLLVENQADFNLPQFKAFLQGSLPHYMIPSLFELVDSFPLLPSGKVNRKALPKPNKRETEENYFAPQTELEHKITEIWQNELKNTRISTEADFFYDLGGHSLTAAKIVSSLRKTPEMHDISILDIYNHPTIKQLAAHFNDASKHQKFETRKAEKHKPSAISYYLCAIGQVFGCLFQYAIGAWQFLIVLFFFTWVVRHIPLFSKEAILIFLALFIGIPIASIIITISAKWLLLGRVKPGIHKLWGWFYFRWWLVERLQRNIFSPEHFIGTPLITLYYRLLGAKIGKNCYISTINVGVHDLLTIGDNSSIGFDARLLGYVVEDGWLKIGSITLGKQCFVGARSVVSIDTVMEDEGKLDDMSMLPIHGHIPKGAFFSGAPACQTIAPEDHITNQKIFVDTSSPMKNCFFGLMHYLCLIFSMMVYYVCYFPALLLITHYHEKTHYLFTVFILAPLGAVLFLGLHYFATALCKRVLMNKIKPGIYPLKSFYYLRQWTIVQMLDIEEVFVMADTLYFPSFLRFLGANLGPRVELGEIPHVLPDLVTIDDEGFIASAVALAWPTVYQGAIAFAPIQVGKRGFVGNMSLLPLGSHVGDGGLLGCMTIAPPNNQAADQNTSWLGSPAIFLPKREQVTGFSDAEKFKPTKRLFYLRLVIEFIRIIMPTSFKMIALFNMLYVLNILSIHHTHHYLPHYMNHYITHHLTLSIFIVFPFVDLLIISTLVFGLIALKWITLGRLKPASKPIWSVFIWKNDVITYIYSYFITPHLTNFILGTPFVSILSRFFGAKIGKKVFIDTADFTEFDLITIDDEVCINAEAVIQTHLYEDRIFKMSTIHIKDGANIGVASVVLYDTVMEKNSTLGNFSLLMKGETLPENTSWQGIPAQPMSTHYYKSQGLTT